MERNLFRYVWKHSRREQLGILLLVLLSMPFYFFSLELPKQIVNLGILGRGFPSPVATQSFLQIELPFGEALFGSPVMLFEGFALRQRDTLLALSFSFLLLVCINGWFKYVINTAKGRVGERMLRRLRFELADRLLRFPLPVLRRMKSAEVATMIKDEVEPLGGFIGDAFVTPIFLGGQALTAMIFILIQSFWLGVVAGAIVLVQAALIPRLRIPILRLGRQRQLTARQLAGRISEVLEGATEVHANDASNWERSELTQRLGRIFGIRFEIYKKKFFVKFLNNFLAQLTPFIFYAGGGLLALSGRLDIGALVAVINAYKDLPSPIRELINWEQQRQDVQIKYDQVVEQFQPATMKAPELQDPDAPESPLSGRIEASGLTLLDEHGNRVLDGISFSLPLDAHVAVVGDAASGKDVLPYVVAGLLEASAGSLRLGGRSVFELPEAVTGRRIGYVDQNAYFFPMSLRDNLLYGLRHRPLRPASRAAPVEPALANDAEEARRAGNSTLDLAADWVDYAAAGASGPEELVDRMLEVLDLVDLLEDVYRFGLSGSINPQEQPSMASRVLEARQALTRELAAQNHSDLVVPFDPLHYNRNATLAENLLFGTPRKPSYEAEALAENALVMSVVTEAGLLEVLTEKGFAIARTMVEIFADLPPGHPFFDQFSFISADDLPEFRQIVTRGEQRGAANLGAEDRLRLQRLPFRYVEARHRLGLIDEGFAAAVVAARAGLAERIGRREPDAVAFYEKESYNASASLLDNILFGRLAYGQAGAQELIGKIVSDVLQRLDLYRAVCEVGLGHDVGIGGKRLTVVQRQKAALARALLKLPDLLVVNEATAVLDGATRSRIVGRVLEARAGKGVFWALERASLASSFEAVLVMRNGRLVQEGEFGELNQEGAALAELVSAD